MSDEERRPYRGGAPKKPLNLSGEHQKLLLLYIEDERSRGHRRKTPRALGRDVPALLRFLEERGLAATEVRLSDARAYQWHLLTRVKSSGDAYALRTVECYMTQAWSFCEYLRRTGKLPDNPFAGVRHVRPEKRIPGGIYKEGQMAKLLDEFLVWDTGDNLKDASRRYLLHVAAELQYASGLRSSEAAALTSEDVDIERALVYVRDGKGGSARIGFLTDYAASVLELYLTRARPLMLNQQKHNARRLFMVDFDRFNHLMNEELARVSASAGLPPIKSHGFRHALGYHLLRSGCPLRYIQAILGHKSIVNTEIYTKVDVEDVKRVFDACHPRMRG